MERLVLTVDELAEAMGISRPKAYELVHRRDGPPVIRIGRTIRIPADGLQTWMARESQRENVS